MKHTCIDNAATKRCHIEDDDEWFDFFIGTPFELEFGILRSFLTKKLSKRDLVDKRHIY